MIDKLKFEQEILDVLKKHEYRIEGIKKIRINLNIDEMPEVSIEYIA